MVNRQSRQPNELRRFDESARIGGVPDYAVDSGQAWRALADVSGQLSGRLGKMADAAAERENFALGQGVGASSGVAYLQMQATQQAAADKNGGEPSGGPMIRMRGDIRKIVSDAATKYGVDPNALLRIAMIESSGNPNAKNPNSSAGGLFQFVDGTARDYGLADRYDPVQAADAAARLARDNAAYLRKRLGRDPNAGELYLAHQQGAGGAGKLLSNPGGDAVATVGADAVRLNGGRAGMTNAEFAGIWIRKAGGGKALASGDDVPIVPVLPTVPLALRRDGTIAGDAYDRGAMSTYAWRLQAGMETAIAGAAEAYPDDPQALAGRLAEIHGEFAKDPNLADPEIGEAFEKRFAERSQAEILQAQSRATTKMREAETSATFEGIAAQRQGIERQGIALGASAEGDKIMEREVTRAGRSIDAALASGSLTPAQAAKAKADLAETAASARVRGVYDALDTPEKKEQFSLQLLEEWTAGKGPLSKLPYDSVKALSTTLWNDARAQINRRTASQKVEAARLEQLIDDDVASMGATGKGLDPKESGLTPDRVATLLGPEKFEAWRTKRGQAAETWSITAGMERESEAEIRERLAILKPTPGEAGFEARQDAYDAAVKRADAVLKERATDPLGAAAKGGAIDLQPIDPSTPETLAQSLAARKAQAEQVSKALETPVPLFRPEEVRALKGSLNSTDPGKHQAVMAQLDFLAAETRLDDIKDTFGDKAVERLQDWQARVRYSTPDEAAAFLKERNDPQWQDRVKPLVTEGLKKARDVPFEDVVAELDTNMIFDAAGPVDAETRRMMMNDFVALTGERFAVTQDIDTARQQAVERMHRSWGVTGAYGTYGGRLMPYPPEKSYPAIGGSQDWIGEQLADFAKGNGLTLDAVSLVADGKTKAAADRGEAPGYLVSAVDPTTGLDELVLGDDGKPRRIFFDPAAAQQEALARAKEDRRTQHDPWLVLGRGTAIGPFYAPWRPATAADMKMRQQRIEEIAGQQGDDRARRMAQKRKVRAVLRGREKE